MLRARDSDEFQDIGLRLLAPNTRVYELIEQVFDVPLWSVRMLTVAAATPGTKFDTPRYSRFLTASTQALLRLVQSGDWERLQIHALLPAHMNDAGQLKLARCKAIWAAHHVKDPEIETWVFDTDCGDFADTEYGLTLGEVQRDVRLWPASAHSGS